MPLNAKKIVLMIEDDQDNFDLLKDIFQERYPDVEIQWSPNGEDALERLNRAKDDPSRSLPHLILLDLNMPRMSGREILVEIRKTEEFQMLPVVVLSGSSNKEEAAELYRLGASSFITKPAGYKTLCDFAETFYTYWFKYAILGLVMMLQPKN